MACNAGLGSFRDNPEWLAMAIEYLRSSVRVRPSSEGKVAQEKKQQGRSYRGVREPAPTYGLAASAAPNPGARRRAVRCGSLRLL